MTATRENIHSWLIRAQQEQATHVIVVYDTFDYTDYPVSVSQAQHVEEEIQRLQSSGMQKIMEVYSLALPIESQLNQRRVWNI
jgi:hypothetical protein